MYFEKGQAKGEKCRRENVAYTGTSAYCTTNLVIDLDE